MRKTHLIEAIRFVLVATSLSFAARTGEAGLLPYNQPSDYPGNFNALTSQDQASGAHYQTFDNFTLTGSGVVESIRWQGFYWNPQGTGNPPAPNTNSFKIGFFQDQNNLPGALIGSAIVLDNLQSAVVGTAQFGPDNQGGQDTVNIMNFSANLHSSFSASANTTYWLSIVSFSSSYPAAWLWTSGTGGDGKSAQLNYGAANAVYITGDRTFLLSPDLQGDLLSSTPPTNPGSGLLADTPLPEPGSLALLAMGLVCGGAARLWRRR